MSVSQEEVTKALKMLNLIHPDAHNELLVIISKMAREINELNAEKFQTQTELNQVRDDIAQLQRNQLIAHEHTKNTPKPV